MSKRSGGKKRNKGAGSARARAVDVSQDTWRFGSATETTKQARYRGQAEVRQAKKDFCEVVEDNCEAPPGHRTGMGGFARGWVRVSTKCDSCGRFVCTKCSKLDKEKRTCLTCVAEEEHWRKRLNAKQERNT